MPRDAVHAQLIGAFRVVVHLSRDSGGRRVSEIGIVRRQDDGRVVCLPAVVDGRAVEPGHAMLEAVLTGGLPGAPAC
jgi:Flp pilus assembly CpaF family ATPase